MLTLHQFAPAFGLPNASPFCMKVETYLRMAGIPYDTAQVTNPASGPYGKAPWIEDDGETIGDSHIIIDHLNHKHGHPLRNGLGEELLAQHHAIARMLEESLYFVLVFERWMVPENATLTREALFAPVPAALRKLVFAMARRSVAGSLRSQGTGRLERAHIITLGNKDIDSLSYVLKDQPFFGGDEPAEIDATAFAFIANFITPPINSPVNDHVRSKDNLVAYEKRMLERLYPA